MTRGELKDAIEPLRSIYGAKMNMPQSVFDIWCNVFCGYDRRIFDAAVNKHIGASSFPPLPADLKRYCDELLSERSKENMYINTNWQFITEERPPREDTPLAKQYFMDYLERFDNRLEQSRTVLRWVQEYKGGKTLEELMKQLCET